MVKTVMIPSDMVCVTILDVAVINHGQVTINRYVVEIGLSPSTRFMSRQTVYRYQARKLLPGSGFESDLSLYADKIPHFFCVLVPGVLVINHVRVADNRCVGTSALSIYNIGLI